MNSEIVNKIIQDHEKARLSTNVAKHLELKFDLGSLLAFDENELKITESNIDEIFLNLARDNTQLLFNKIFSLPTEKKDEVTCALLPKQSTVLPRALPPPKPRELTKWEQFAKEKGIQKKKKDKLAWDDILKKWVPLHGYKRAQAEKEKDWVIEVPGNADPYEDQFEKKRTEKNERVAKNEYQRLRNLAKANKIKVPKTGLLPTAKTNADSLGAALTLAKVSTASLGKFQAELPKEKTAKNVKHMLPGNRKRKQSHLQTEEKVRNLKLIDNILNKKPKITIEQAVDKEVRSMKAEENKKPRHTKKKGTGGGKTKKGAKGGKFRGPQTKSAAGGGKAGPKAKVGGKPGAKVRVGGKTKGGRKRR